MDMENSSWIDFTITRGPIRGKDRNRVGLIIRIRARRDVEDYMASLGQGRRSPVSAYGDLWENAALEGGELEYYEADNRLEPNKLYSLDSIGNLPIIERNAGGRANRLDDGGFRATSSPDELTNLAFLRLVGISDESGVTVGIVGPFSNEYIKRLKTLLLNATKQFLHDYVVPITINLQVVSRG